MNKATLSKEEGRALLRELVMAELQPMVRAQVHNSKGLTHMMLRRPDGTFKRAENGEEIEAALNSGDPTSYYIYTKDPSTAAFTDLMNRALDKPKEQEQDVNLKGDHVLTIRIEKPW